MKIKSSYEESEYEQKQKDVRINKFNRLAYILISLNIGLSNLSDLSIQYFCKDVLKLQPSEFSRYITITQIPWIIKPIFGLLTDSVPIFGTRRKFYMIFSGLIGVLAWTLISFFTYNLFFLILFLTLMNSGLSFMSVLGEAIVVELSKLKSINLKNEITSLGNKYKENKDFQIEMKMNLSTVTENNTNEMFRDNTIEGNVNLEQNLKPDKNKENKKQRILENKENDFNAKDYISLFFFFKYTGNLISSILKGFLIKYYSPSTIFLITGSIYILTIISGIIFIENNTKETKKGIVSKDKDHINFKYSELKETGNGTYKTENQNKNNNENYYKNFNSGNEQKIYDNNKEDSVNKSFNSNTGSNNISIKDQIKLIFKFLFQKYIFIPTIILIIFMSTPSYDDPMFYFFTEELKLTSIDLGLISTFSIIFTLLAILFYKLRLKKYSFRSMVVGCTIISFFISFMSYVLTKRYNLVIGISDMFLIIFSTSINSLLGELTLMPMLSLACLLSPKNLEGTAYSIFMSALNLGGGISILSGSFLTRYMEITSKDFTNLPRMIIISNILYLLPLFLLFIIKKSYFSPEEIEGLNEDEEREKKIDFIQEEIIDHIDIK